MLMLFIVIIKCGNHTFLFSCNISDDFASTSLNFHTQFHHTSQKNMTQLLIPKLQYKCLKKSGCGSCHAPLTHYSLGTKAP